MANFPDGNPMSNVWSEFKSGLESALSDLNSQASEIGAYAANNGNVLNTPFTEFNSYVSFLGGLGDYLYFYKTVDATYFQIYKVAIGDGTCTDYVKIAYNSSRQPMRICGDTDYTYILCLDKYQSSSSTYVMQLCKINNSGTLPSTTITPDMIVNGSSSTTAFYMSGQDGNLPVSMFVNNSNLYIGWGGKTGSSASVRNAAVIKVMFGTSKVYADGYFINHQYLSGAIPPRNVVYDYTGYTAGASGICIEDKFYSYSNPSSPSTISNYGDYDSVTNHYTEFKAVQKILQSGTSNASYNIYYYLIRNNTDHKLVSMYISDNCDDSFYAYRNYVYRVIGFNNGTYVFRIRLFDISIVEEE